MLHVYIIPICGVLCILYPYVHVYIQEINLEHSKVSDEFETGQSILK